MNSPLVPKSPPVISEQALINLLRRKSVTPILGSRSCGRRSPQWIMATPAGHRRLIRAGSDLVQDPRYRLIILDNRKLATLLGRQQMVSVFGL